MKILKCDIAAACGVSVDTLNRWIEKLESAKKFGKRSVGRGYSIAETRELAKLVDVEFTEITAQRLIRIEAAKPKVFTYRKPHNLG